MRTQLRWRYPILAVAVVLCSPVDRAEAQTNAETSGPWLQLNLSVPGARSLGLGGAFVALADDATAAYANPAGLAFLPGLEATAEFRSWSYRHVYTDDGRLDEGLVIRSEADDSARDLSFASFSKGGAGWGFAFYRHQLANFRADFETQGLRIDPNRRLFPSRIRHEVKIANHGASVAKAWPRIGFSVGVGLAYYEFKIRSELERFSLDRLEDPPNFDPSNVHDRQIQIGNDEDLAPLLGLLYWPTEKWRIGASFRGGGTFRVEARSERGPAFIGTSPEVLEPDAVFQIPRVLGLGVVYTRQRRRPARETGAATELRGGYKVAFDAYWIDYSVLAEDITDIFGLGEAARLDRFTVDDGVELHLGLERTLRGGKRKSLFLRLGAWYDPDHALRFDSDLPVAFRAVFPQGEDIMHYSLGLGSSGYRYQIDGAIEYSERITTVSVSSVVRF